jgi:hypothetical protein
MLDEALQSIELLPDMLWQELGEPLLTDWLQFSSGSANKLYVWNRENDVVALYHSPTKEWKEKGWYNYELIIVPEFDDLKKKFFGANLNLNNENVYIYGKDVKANAEDEAPLLLAGMIGRQPVTKEYIEHYSHGKKEKFILPFHHRLDSNLPELAEYLQIARDSAAFMRVPFDIEPVVELHGENIRVSFPKIPNPRKDEPRSINPDIGARVTIGIKSKEVLMRSYR